MTTYTVWLYEDLKTAPSKELVHTLKDLTYLVNGWLDKGPRHFVIIEDDIGRLYFGGERLL